MCWQNAIHHFERIARENRKHGDILENDIAIANMCRYIYESSFRDKLEVRSIWNHSLFLGPVNSFLNKSLKAEAILGNEVEFCLKDSKTHVERYFLPHAPYSEALDRFKAILSNIEWSSTVKSNSMMDRFFWPMTK